MIKVINFLEIVKHQLENEIAASGQMQETGDKSFNSIFQAVLSKLSTELSTANSGELEHKLQYSKKEENLNFSQRVFDSKPPKDELSPKLERFEGSDESSKGQKPLPKTAVLLSNDEAKVFENGKEVLLLSELLSQLVDSQIFDQPEEMLRSLALGKDASQDVIENKLGLEDLAEENQETLSTPISTPNSKSLCLKGPDELERTQREKEDVRNRNGYFVSQRLDNPILANELANRKAHEINILRTVNIGIQDRRFRDIDIDVLVSGGEKVNHQELLEEDTRPELVIRMDQNEIKNNSSTHISEVKRVVAHGGYKTGSEIHQEEPRTNNQVENVNTRIFRSAENSKNYERTIGIKNLQPSTGIRTVEEQKTGKWHTETAARSEGRQPGSMETSIKLESGRIANSKQYNRVTVESETVVHHNADLERTEGLSERVYFDGRNFKLMEQEKDSKVIVDAQNARLEKMKDQQSIWSIVSNETVITQKLEGSEIGQKSKVELLAKESSIIDGKKMKVELLEKEPRVVKGFDETKSVFRHDMKADSQITIQKGNNASLPNAHSSNNLVSDTKMAIQRSFVKDYDFSRVVSKSEERNVNESDSNQVRVNYLAQFDKVDLVPERFKTFSFEKNAIQDLSIQVNKILELVKAFHLHFQYSSPVQNEKVKASGTVTKAIAEDENKLKGHVDSKPLLGLGKYFANFKTALESARNTESRSYVMDSSSHEKNVESQSEGKLFEVRNNGLDESKNMLEIKDFKHVELRREMSVEFERSLSLKELMQLEKDLAQKTQAMNENSDKQTEGFEGKEKNIISTEYSVLSNSESLNVSNSKTNKIELFELLHHSLNLREIYERIRDFTLSARTEERIDIKLRPDFLGNLEIQLRKEGSALYVTFVTESKTGKEMLEKGMFVLREKLAELDFEVRSVEVKVHEEDQHMQERDDRKQHSGQQEEQFANQGKKRWVVGNDDEREQDI